MRGGGGGGEGVNFFIIKVKAQIRDSLSVSSFLHIEFSERMRDAVLAPKCCRA